MCTNKTNLQSRTPLSSTLWIYGGRTRRASSKWSQPMREVCATRKACPCHGGKSQSAHWRSTRCASAAAKGPFKRSHSEPGEGGAQPRHTAKPFSLSVCLHFHLYVCLTVSMSLPQPVGELIQLKTEKGKPPPRGYILIHPWFNLHWSAESHTYHCERGAHCLSMNQGHWKIKADCCEIITDCSCGIILMRLGLTKPCLLHTMASLWDAYC